jgi:tRNA A22 N-methylase
MARTMMSSSRLQALHAHYQGERSVWDIGCDHGLLGLSFLTHPQSPFIHLVDPSAEVIEVLEKKLKGSHIPIGDVVHLWHRKGQELKLSDNDKKIIFIAGMGGGEIFSILCHLIPQLGEGDRVIISPHRGIWELRANLEGLPLGPEFEYTLEERGQFYQIIGLNFYSKLRITPYGQGIWTGPVGERYQRHILKAFEIHQDPRSRELVSHLKKLNS